MTLWDAILTVLGSIGSPVIIAGFGAICVLLGVVAFIGTAAEAIFWTGWDRWLPMVLAACVLAVLFGASLMTWASSSAELWEWVTK